MCKRRQGGRILKYMYLSLLCREWFWGRFLQSLLEMLVVLGCGVEGVKEMGNNWQIDTCLEDRVSRNRWSLNVECDKDRVSSRTLRFLAGSAEHMVSFTLMEMTRGEWEGGGGMKKGREGRDRGWELRGKEGRMGKERKREGFQRRLMFISFGACFGI